MSLVRRATQIVACVVLAAVLSEGIAHAVLAVDDRVHPMHVAAVEADLYRPHHHRGYRIEPHAPSLPERGPHDRHGFRGPEISEAKPAHAWRIACIGGSATYGTKLASDAETWPRRLEAILRETVAPVEVLNAGVPAYNAADSLQLVREVLLGLQCDLVLVLHGANDVMPRLRPGFRVDYAHMRRTWEWTDWRAGETSASALVTLLKRHLAAPSRPLALRVLTTHPYSESEAVEAPAFASSTPAAFRQHVRSIADVLRGAGVTPLLLTQPWDPAHLQKDLAHRGPLYGKALPEHRDAVRDVGTATGAAVVDLAAEMPIAGNFADFVHPNARGAEWIAQRLATEIRERGLLSKR